MRESREQPDARSRQILTGSFLLVRVLALLTNALVARLIGKADYGAAGASLAIGSLLAAPLSAVQWAVTRQVATAPRGHYVLRRLSLTVYAGALVVVVIGVAASGLVDQALHLHGIWPSTFVTIFLAAVLIEGVPTGVLIGEGRFRYVAICMLLGAALKVAISVVWGFVHPNVTGPLAGAGLGELITALALTAPIFGQLMRSRGKRHISFGQVWLSVAGSTGLLAIMSIDTIAARHWLSGAGSGMYAVASALGSGVYFAASSAIAARYPDVSRGAEVGSSRAFWQSLAEVSGLAVAACAVLVVFSGLAIRLVFGSQYAQARAPLDVLSVSYALLGILSFLVNHLLAHRTPAIMLPWLGTVVLVVLVFIRHGSTVVVATDALIASASIFVAMLLVSLRLERRSGRASAGGELTGVEADPLAASAMETLRPS